MYPAVRYILVYLLCLGEAAKDFSLWPCHYGVRGREPTVKENYFFLNLKKSSDGHLSSRGSVKALMSRPLLFFLRLPLGKTQTKIFLASGAVHSFWVRKIYGVDKKKIREKF